MPVRQNYKGFDTNESFNSSYFSFGTESFLVLKKSIQMFQKMVVGGQETRRIWQSLISQVRFCSVVVGRIPYRSDNSDYYLPFVYLFSIP